MMDVSSVKRIASTWMDLLLQKDAAAFAALFEEDGVYIDPAFGIARKGTKFVSIHHEKWHAAVPDFRADIERILVDGRTAIIQYLGQGTFNGEALGAQDHRVEPTGKTFKARAVVILDLSEAGRVRSCVEYYDRLSMPNGDRRPFADDLTLDGL